MKALLLQAFKPEMACSMILHSPLVATRFAGLGAIQDSKHAQAAKLVQCASSACMTLGAIVARPDA